MKKVKFDPFKNLVLDKYEQEIENAIESEEFESVPIPPKELTMLKKAVKLGLRYQTLAGSILHQYVQT